MTADDGAKIDGDGGDGPGGQGVGADAYEEAKARAAEALQTVLQVMRAPKRNSATKLAAAAKILDLAGVGADANDRLHVQLLEDLKGKLSPEAYAEVIQALCERAGLG